MTLTAQFRQCDVCGMFTNRVHHTTVTGIDTTACDECFQYDAEAYGEPLAQFLTEGEYNRDRQFEVEKALEEALVHCTAEQVAEAIINIFSDKDIGLICGRLITPRQQT